MTTTMSSPIAFLSLPTELIESILVCSCSPRTVASVSQTCRALHALVYASSDSHLWRELFLIHWDDPRPALEHRALVDPRIDPAAWDWASEYRRRVYAERWLKAWRRDVYLPDADADSNVVKSHTSTSATTDAHSAWRTTAHSVLSTVLDTLLTLQPFPASPPISLTVFTPDMTVTSPYPAGRRAVPGTRQQMTGTPPLPPLLIILASGISVCETSKSGIRLGRMVFGPHATRVPAERLMPTGTGTGTTTLIPTPALPPQLMRTLLASRVIGVRGLPAYTPFLSRAAFRGRDPLNDVFHRIVCITGFVPVSPPLSVTATESASSADARDLKDEGDLETTDEEDRNIEPENHPKRWKHRTFPTPSQQHADARILARRRVYDMQYLRGDRMWGPYHVVTRSSFDASPATNILDSDRKGESREGTRHAGGRGRDIGTLAWSMGVDVDPDEIDSDSTSDDSKDEDWRDPGDLSSQGSSADDADMDIEREHPLISLILAPTDTSDTIDVDPVTDSASSASRSSSPQLPISVSLNEIKPHHLRPDYAYLASARIVVEANLRELFRNGISDDVEQSAPGVGLGGVDMFWEDEDEILRAQVRSSGQAYSAPSSPATSPGSGSAPSTDSNTLELTDILSQFQNIEVARLGSTCGYWGGWVERQQFGKGNANGDMDTPASPLKNESRVRKPRIVVDQVELENPIEEASDIEGKGKGKGRNNKPRVPAVGGRLGDWEIGPEGEACEGWDWAGVTGIWRRCVCWMDYRELLFFNLDSSKFLTLDTQEACRIIPMELRITGYSRSALMPVYDSDDRNNINVLHPDNCSCTGYFRPPPAIHFDGASIGSDRGMDDSRKVRGIVQLIGGGEIRWQLETYTQDSDSALPSDPEWSSEAVQVGGIGSAVGLLGLWTGAEHERADPLGPFWAWKVA